MRIAVDAMGGDHAPREVVWGALLSCRDPGHEVVLVGRPDRLRECIAEFGGASDRVSICPAEDVVAMGESPAAACKRRETSIAVAVQLVRDGRAEAVVSAGNSGAFMACALVRLDRPLGVERPAIAVCLPKIGGVGVLIDAGANADCKPHHLVQFAQMGRVYARDVLGVNDPAVGLLSIGEEATKGTGMTKAAHKLLSDLGGEMNFIGNVEGDGVFIGAADVVVCDGFTGNVFLKTAEGTATALFQALRGAFARSLRARLGALLARPALRELKATFDYATYGGALLLGVNGICVVSHGRSDSRAIRNAIAVARRSVEGRVVEHIAHSCRQLATASAAN